MALGLSVTGRLQFHGSGFAVTALACAVLSAGCRSNEEKPVPPPVESLAPVTASAPPPEPEKSTAAAPSAAPEGALDPATSFLVGTQGEAVSLRSLDGRSRIVVPGLSSWQYDPTHGLLWFLDEDRLGVADLRVEGSPKPLAKKVPEGLEIWVDWPTSKSRYVRPETGCEETSNAVEIKLGKKPSLRLVETGARRALSEEGRRWLEGQAKRVESPPSLTEAFDTDAGRVALPKGWSGCDDSERCGRSASFGASPLRLVLARDTQGADCFQRRCLLFDPATKQFASPPVLVDAQGTPSLPAGPPRWASATEAIPGSCGPYRFDGQGTTFVVLQYLCKLDASKTGAACEELPGEGIGWLRPGAVVGSPG